MNDDFLRDLLPIHGEAIDPVELARRDQQKRLPKKFFSRAEATAGETGFVLSLDGRPARTPGGNPLSVPSRPLAEALAAEWNGLGEVIDPAVMPLTRIVNSAIDGVAREAEAVRDEIVNYAGSDLLCYRAGEPNSLVAAQSAAWDPVLDWARDKWDVRFSLAEGVMFVAQSDMALDAVREAAARLPVPFALAGVHVMTTLTGSALLALAVAAGQISPEDAWAAAHVDEDHQMRAWGTDAEAMARRDHRWTEMKAATLLVGLGAAESPEG